MFIFHFLFILEGQFHQIHNLELAILFFTTWTCWAIPSGLYDFLWEIYCHSNHSSPVSNVLFSSCCSLSLILRRPITVCPDIDLSLSCLYFAQLLDSESLCFLPNLGSFQSLFIWTFLFPYASWTQWHKCYISCYCPTGLWGSLHFFLDYFLSLIQNE
jgi:hypothetical protein